MFFPQWSQYGNSKISKEKEPQKMPTNDCSVGAGQQATEVNMLNSKLAYDIASQNLVDNQSDSRAWAAHKLTLATDAQTAKQLALMGLLQLSQNGATENQNLTKPVPNAVVDDITATAGGAISSATAQAALGNVTAQLAELTTQVVGLAALLSQFITNAGNAASPKA
jgi:hypothetical protein